MEGQFITREESAWKLGRFEGEAVGMRVGARDVIFTQGQILFGEIPEAYLKKLWNQRSMKRLLELGKRLLKVSSWEELFKPDSPKPSSRWKRRSSK